jgi:type III secretion protein J
MVRVAPLIALLFLAGCHARIQHGLDEAEANEIQTVLLEHGFDPRKVPEGGKKPSWAIEVRDEHAAPATRVLSELGLPRKRLNGFSGMEMGLVPTPTQERAAQLNALSEELSRTLQSIAGVTLARVHLVVPQPARPGQAPQKAKASAFLRVRPGYGAQVKGMEEELRGLLSGSVEGLSPEEVSLVVNEVVSAVPTVPPSSLSTQKVRWLVAGLGMLVTLLSLGLMVVGLRMRVLRVQAPIGAPSAVTARARTQPGTQRRAA